MTASVRRPHRRPARADRDPQRGARRPVLDALLADGTVQRVSRGRYAFTADTDAAAGGRAQGPFESVLRAVALGVPGLHVVPQVRIVTGGRLVARVDLADEQLRIVLQADSFEFHGERRLLERDCRRYDELVAAGWVVLRFSWEQVMTQPDGVREMLVAAVALRRRQGLPYRRPLAAVPGQ